MDLKHIDAATLCQDVISLKKEFSKVKEDAALISAQVVTISEIKDSLEDFKSTMKQSMQLCRSNAEKDADITKLARMFMLCVVPDKFVCMFFRVIMDLC